MKAKAPKPTKLTNAVCNKLATALTHQAKRANYERKNALGKAIAEAALVANYGEDWEKKFNEIPEGWLPKMSDLRVFSDSFIVHVSLGRLVPLPHMLENSRLLLNDNTLLQEYSEQAEYYANKFSQGMYRSGGKIRYMSHFQKNMEDALAAINTEEELKEIWPEAFELLQGMKQQVPEPPPTTPLAIPVASIIEMYRNSLAAKPQEEEKEEDNVTSN